MLALTAFWICLFMALGYLEISMWWLFGIIALDMILRFCIRVGEKLKEKDKEVKNGLQ